jgi:Flp pilus assembly protein TadG
MDDMRRARQRGQALAEMAFVVVLLVMLSLGVIDFGRMLMTVNVITHAARDGARQVALLHEDRWVGSPPALSGADLATVRDSVRAQIATVMPTSEANAFNVAAARTPAGGVGDEASVTVTGNVPFLFSFPGIWGGTINITRTATYRFEG